MLDIYVSNIFINKLDKLQEKVDIQQHCGLGYLISTLFARVPSAFCVITTEPLYLRPPIVKYKSEALGFIRFTTQVRVISELDSETSIFISSNFGFTVKLYVSMMLKQKKTSSR